MPKIVPTAGRAASLARHSDQLSTSAASSKRCWPSDTRAGSTPLPLTGHAALDVGGAVEGVEDDAVLAAVLRLHVDGLLLLLRHQHRALPALAQHVLEDLVGHDVQLLLVLALHVGAPGLAQHVAACHAGLHAHRTQGVVSFADAVAGSSSLHQLLARSPCELVTTQTCSLRRWRSAARSGGRAPGAPLCAAGSRSRRSA